MSGERSAWPPQARENERPAWPQRLPPACLARRPINQAAGVVAKLVAKNLAARWGLGGAERETRRHLAPRPTNLDPPLNLSRFRRGFSMPRREAAAETIGKKMQPGARVHSCLVLLLFPACFGDYVATAGKQNERLFYSRYIHGSVIYDTS